MSSGTKTHVVSVLKTRLDKFLAEQLPDISRSRIQRDIEEGQVKVNGEVVAVSKHVVRKDDKVEYNYIPDVQPEPKNIPLHTLYNNYDLLILDKPAGLAVHPGAGFTGDSLAQALLYHFKDIYLVGEEGRHGIVHRLDKDTSGVMVVALSQTMYEYLKEAFSQRKIKKEYIALAKGKIEPNHGLIEKSLGKSKRDFRKYTTDKTEMVLEKPSLTEYWVIEYLTDGVDFYTLIRLKLHTGRTHQIRVHLASEGFPLIGDQLYGGKQVMKFDLDHQFLHSQKIEVQLPNGEWVEAQSKLPTDLRDVLKRLSSKQLNQL